MADRQAAMFGAVPQVRTLRSGLVDALVEQIESGELAPGQRLPTEQEIVATTGVSRTVVREALASLRARGLITTRQGLGAFVAAEASSRPFQIVPRDIETIDEVLRVLELRMGVEVEAAGLAAARRSDADLERMRACLAALDAAIDAGESGAGEDSRFHRTVLAATANDKFTRLFDAFGDAMIPRQWADLDGMSPADQKRYRTRMQTEHRSILAAIEARDADAARRAMRSHLEKSYGRFEKLRSVTEHATPGVKAP